MSDLPPPRPSGWLHPAPAASAWIDGPTGRTPAASTPDAPDLTPPPFVKRPLAPSLQAPTPEPPEQPPATPPTAPQAPAASRWHWTTRGWLWGYMDTSGFVHPVEIRP